MGRTLPVMQATGFSFFRLLHEATLHLGGSRSSYWRQLDDLRALDDRLLRDIGLSRADAARGGPRPEGDNDTMLLFVTSGLSRGV